jgi:Ca-activated chloride channel homolog
MKFRGINIKNAKPAEILLTFAFMLIPLVLNAQSEKKYIRQGNREYDKNKYAESEISYRKALDKNKQSPDAVFNAGDALYKQKKYEDAGKLFQDNISMNEDKKKKAEGYYNLGNSFLKANKLKESIEAYKSSLKLQPDSRETKYNLAYAQDLLRKQEQQQQQQQQQQDKKDQDKDKKKQDNKNDQNKDQQNNENKSDQDKDQNQQQKQQQEISKEDAQNLLNAIANDEKKVQEKVKLEKARKEKVRTIKNW